MKDPIIINPATGRPLSMTENAKRKRRERARAAEKKAREEREEKRKRGSES